MTQPQVPTTAETDAARPTFDAIPLSPDVRKAIDEMGYVNPTPVQLAVFEPASRGKSLVVQARTGTGKTAAFGLPIVDALVKRSQANVQALILCPTRELALQVGRELEQLAHLRGIKIVPIYGGAPMGRQVAALEEGAQVVVGTPGRVLDHLRRGTLDPSNIRIFVLDEADEMLSMGFAKELNAIIETLPRERQGLYFSATIPPDVERLANSHLHDPEYVTLSSDQIGALEIAHFVYLVREGDKRGALGRIVEVENPESAIVFCNTKDETERTAEMLRSRGYDADWLNGDLDQREREKVMAKTREGKLRFLVATDVAARGIDISHLTHVINADFPESAEQYVHRTGRTGRAGKTGTAISVVGPKDVGHLYMLRLTYKIRPIERTLPTKGELRTRAEADLVAFLADAYLGKTPDPTHLAVARRLLTHEAAEAIIAGLLADHLGAGSNVAEEAADVRRAKNPPPVPAPREPEPPRTRREGPAGRDRARSRDRDRDGARERPPQSALRDWEPPADEDDDRPILAASAEAPARRAEPRRGARTRGPREAERSRAPAPPVEDDDDDVDTTRRPDLPGFTEEPAGATPGRSAPRGERGGRSTRERREPREKREPRERREPRDADDRIEEGYTNLFVNVGRRDGVDPSSLTRLLGAAVDASDVGRIRVRDRMSFVAVRSEHAERAIQALAGQVVGGRTIAAEPARDR